ncbi:geranylgeranylglyceryl/heptaprenylglyceryl phosphate synthase [Paenibacillus antarcticus]|uniref:Heptaprenylglyceryl phosphate synthase n=2 Tax=Paenibacillus antarcticus TaxID=253703 RepID=A0A168KBA3_9BACL|nr:heptaprenylglyceryl phosphate synthase [Paenibacillus antarcticus]OAB41800.1 geranylgeranylglyceryl/heptaprenylglyceryl phosphate synthase [Paenibacillus antarcticus]
MKEMLKSWRHIFKLDPDRNLDDQSLNRVCLSGTDAIMVGGSTGVTYENTVDLLSRIRSYELPCVQEVSDMEAIVPGFDLYMIPMVLNSSDPSWIVGHQQQAIDRYGYMIPWELLVTEGYIVLNPDSAVARLTGANTLLDTSGTIAYAQVADRLMSLPVVYLEYSGTFGDMETVRGVHQKLTSAQLIYGGGIKDLNTAKQAASVSDTIVVGNIIYEDLEQALQTVLAVK